MKKYREGLKYPECWEYTSFEEDGDFANENLEEYFAFHRPPRIWSTKPYQNQVNNLKFCKFKLESFYRCLVFHLSAVSTGWENHIGPFKELRKKGKI